MFLLLVLEITLYIKEYMINSRVTYAEYSYVWAFGLPMILIILVSSDIIYEKYIAKLEQSHRLIYTRFVTCLIAITISAMISIILMSIFMSNPVSMRYMAILALVPYYIGWSIVAGFFIYVSPGLID